MMLTDNGTFQAGTLQIFVSNMFEIAGTFQAN